MSAPSDIEPPRPWNPDRSSLTFEGWLPTSDYANCSPEVKSALAAAWDAGRDSRSGVWLAYYKLRQIADGDLQVLTVDNIREHAKSVVDSLADLRGV